MHLFSLHCCGQFDVLWQARWSLSWTAISSFTSWRWTHDSRWSTRSQRWSPAPTSCTGRSRWAEAWTLVLQLMRVENSWPTQMLACLFKREEMKAPLLLTFRVSFHRQKLPSARRIGIYIITCMIFEPPQHLTKYFDLNFETFFNVSLIPVM